jgi:hypothetical protein
MAASCFRISVMRQSSFFTKFLFPQLYSVATPAMEFSGAAPRSCVTSSDLEIYRERFNFPEDVRFRVPRVGEGATSLKGGNEICLSLQILEAGFRLPGPRVIREVL